MQVNLSTNLPNPAGEANAKCSELPNADASNGFSAQMGQILNRGEKSNNALQDDASSAGTSGASRQKATRFPSDAASHTPQAPNVKKATIQNLSASLSGLFQTVDGAGSGMPDVQSTLQVAGKSGGLVLLAGVESSPVQIKDGEKEDAGLVSSVQLPVIPAVAVDNPQSQITLDLSAHVEEILHSQKADSFVANEGKTTGEADSDTPIEAFRDVKPAGIHSEAHIMGQEGKTVGEADSDTPIGAFRDVKTTGIYSETHNPIAVGSKPDSSQNINKTDHRSENARQPRWDADPETYISTKDQDKVQSAQLNFDFLAAAKSAESREIPGQSLWTFDMSGRSHSEDVELSEKPEPQDNISPSGILKKSLKAVLESMKNAETAGAFANQEQAEYKAGFEGAMQSKPELRQLDPVRAQSSAVERQSPMQSVPASSPAQSRESAASASAPPASSSTAHVPEPVLQLADQMRIQVRDGKGEIRIQLKPDSLGRLEIIAENTAHGVSARISTESNAVKSYLENNLQVLQQTLQDQGLKIDRIHIIVQDASDSQSSSGLSAQFGHTGSGQNGREPQFSSEKSGPSILDSVDEAVWDPESWLAMNPNKRFHTVA
jgi:hypothetical protein